MTLSCIHGFGLGFKGGGGSASKGGIEVKIRAWFLARIWAVREPQLEAKILKKIAKKLHKCPKTGQNGPVVGFFSRFLAPIAAISTRKPI
jgi:hypothetical protein